MTRAHYSDSELAAFSAADKLADGLEVPAEELRHLLNKLACDGERMRRQLDRALDALVESNKRKRESVRDIIRMEQNSQNNFHGTAK